MDLALTYNPALQAFDLSLDAADLAAEDSLASAVIASLLCDRLAQNHEVAAGEDRRGWWADAYAGDAFGSRLWLLHREKQTQSTMQRAKAYIEESLQWMIDDGLVRAITVAVFAPRMNWLVAQVRLELNGQSRSYRFEWNDADQVWRLSGGAM